MLKSYEEIIDRCREPISIYGHDIELFLEYLPYKHAKEFLLDNDNHHRWDLYIKQPTKEIILADMEKEMFTIWSKILFHAHIFGEKSIERVRVWLWFLGDDDLIKFAKNDNNYPLYGAPIFAKICEKYNFNIPDSEEIQNMVNGKPCNPDCTEGCIE